MSRLLIPKIIRAVFLLIWYSANLGYPIWITGLIFFIFWRKRISTESFTPLELVFTLTVILTILPLAINLRFLQKRIFSLNDNNFSKAKRVIGLILLISFISYKIYINSNSEKFRYIKETQYTSEIEIIRKNKIPEEWKLAFPYIEFRRMKKILDEKFDVFPVSMPSHSYILYCYDGEKWIYYKTDRFGFRNNDKLWDEAEKIFLIGQDISECSERSFAEEIQNELDVKVIDLTGRSENIIISFMKILEFLEKDKSKLNLIIISNKSFLNIEDFWDKDLIDRYINTKSEGQNLKDIKSDIDKELNRYFLAKMNEKDVFAPFFKIYEKLYSPWGISELLKLPKKQEIISEIDLQIGKFILTEIIRFLDKEKVIFFILIDKYNRKQLEEIKDFMEDNGIKVAGAIGINDMRRKIIKFIYTDKEQKIQK